MRSSPTFPDAAQPRIAALDVVRGVAVLGIVIANIAALGQPLAAGSWPGAFLSPPGPLADWLWGVQLVLIDGKFRGLFAMLFGAGMVLFYRGTVARGDGHGLLARRLGWLGVFGLLHWALLWRGDILLSYAVAGLVALAFVGWDWTKQLTLGLIGYAVGSVVAFSSSVPMATTAAGEFPPGSSMADLQDALFAAEATEGVDARIEAALIAAGDQIGLWRHTLNEHLAALPLDIMLALFEEVPLMLIGMALLGAGLFDGGVTARRQRTWGWILWLVGTIATIPIAIWAVGRGITFWDSFAALNGWSALPRLASALGLMALLALWGQRSASWLALRLTAAGRVAFTNYIATSALALGVFSGWGLGLFGRLGRLELYGIAVLFCAIMLAWPGWWLERFRYGPLEWLWRCLTYGQRLPLRR